MTHKMNTTLWKNCWLVVANLFATTKPRSKPTHYLLLTLLLISLPTRGLAQSVVPASDETGTVVTPDGNQFNITEGQTSGDGANLFHSFSEFGLDANQTANFISNSTIQNIFARVTGGNPSIINGLLQVTGGNSNLFLMNPAGIVFGENAQLNVPASFTATTATGIGIGDNWFNAQGANNYATLISQPNAFTFKVNTAHPGSIVNAGSLAVESGQNLNLIGGTVVSTGGLKAPGGEISVTTVPGESTVQIRQAGYVLSLEVQPSDSIPLTPLTLPQLLTGSGQIPGLEVNGSGDIRLVGSGIAIENGDIVARGVNSQTATLSAQHNLTLVESQLQTTGNLNLLANDTVRIRDSVVNPFLAQTGGNLYIQGNQSIDILALNHPTTPFKSGGNLSLVSNGNIFSDAHFASGGNFSILNLSGEPGNFISFYDPIISVDGDVEFGNYEGVALKVEATGSIQGGNITITGADSLIPTDEIDGSDLDLLSRLPTLILRAGVASVTAPEIVGTSPVIPFDIPATPLPSGSISVGNINTSVSSGNSGPVILSAPGNITTGTITTTATVNGVGNGSGTANAGDVTISSTQGNISTGMITTTATVNGVGGMGSGTANAGDVNLTAPGSIEYGDIDANANVNGNQKNSTLTDGAISVTASEMPPRTPPNPDNAFLPGDTLGTAIDMPNAPTNEMHDPDPTDSSGQTTTNPDKVSPVDTGNNLLDSGNTSLGNTGGSSVNTGNRSNSSVNTGNTIPRDTGSSSGNTGSTTSGNRSNSSGNTGNTTPGDTGTGSDNTNSNQSSSTNDQSNTNSSVDANQMNSVAEFEKRFTRQFEQYLDLPEETPLKTIAQSREILANTERVTGAKPALIYVGFSPKTIATDGSTTAPFPTPSPQDQLEILLVTAQGTPIRKEIEGVTREQVLRVANEFRSQVTNVRSPKGYVLPGQQLYNWFVKPLEAEFQAQGIENLVFILDTNLRSVPVAALYDGQQFLIEKYSVGLMPSISLTDTRYQPVTNLEVLAMGASQFIDQQSLPAVPVELSEIQTIWQGKSLLNEAFTVENLKEQQKRRPFGMIHLATHANFVPGEVGNSYIQFWDKKLRLNELSELGLNNPTVELLVLSACRTALGNEEAELGFAGLAVQAGVKSAMGSLWYVSDEGTLGLMTEFYQQLKQAPIKAEAIRQAQLAMLKGQVYTKNGKLITTVEMMSLPPELASLRDQTFEHPYYWSAFTMIGSPW